MIESNGNSSQKQICFFLRENDNATKMIVPNRSILCVFIDPTFDLNKFSLKNAKFT